MLIDKLQNELTRLPMHMPGHKRNANLAPYLKRLGADLDITEIRGFDDLHSARGVLLSAMRGAAELWGSGRAFFLVNGATSGVLAGAHAALACKRGRVLMARNCHLSAYHALELCARDVAYLQSEYDARFGVYTRVKPETVARALGEHSDAALVLLTSPTYEGAISDIKEICSIAHAKRVPVMADAAHGAHLGLGGGFPEGAIRAGADIVVNSLHKTLPSLTQTAVMHVSGGLVDAEQAARALDIFETSSPSYLLLASIDGCVRLLGERGGELLPNWQAALSVFERLTRGLSALDIMGRAPGGERDGSKIVVSAARRGVSGFELMDILRDKYNIELEMAQPNCAVALTGMGDTESSLRALAEALIDIDARLPANAPLEPVPPAPIPARALRAFDALNAPAVYAPFDKARGRVCAEYIWAYPPGIPLIAPGEIIDDAALAHADTLIARGVSLRASMGAFGREIRVLA